MILKIVPKADYEGNAIISSPNKIFLERDFAAGVYLSKALNHIHPPLSHPLKLIVEPKRWGEGQQGRVQITKLGTKYQYVCVALPEYFSVTLSLLNLLG